MWAAKTDISPLQPITDATIPCEFPSQESVQGNFDDLPLKKRPLHPPEYELFEDTNKAVDGIVRARGGHKALPLPVLSDSEDSLEGIANRVGEMALENAKGHKEKQQQLKAMRKKKLEKEQQEDDEDEVEDDDDDEDDEEDEDDDDNDDRYRSGEIYTSGLSGESWCSDEDSPGTMEKNLDNIDPDAEGHHSYSKPNMKDKIDVDNVGGANVGAVKADRWFASLSPPKFE